MSNRRSPSPRLFAAAILLPCVGLFLLMPPVIGLFAIPRDVAGIPLIVFYLFGVWLGLVACAAWLSRRIGDSGPGTGTGSDALPPRHRDEDGG